MSSLAPSVLYIVGIGEEKNYLKVCLTKIGAKVIDVVGKLIGKSLGGTICVSMSVVKHVKIMI